MKKRLLCLVAPMLLLGSMNVSAQVETVSNSKETQKETPKNLEEARADFFQANETLNIAATETRNQLTLAQKDVSAKKEVLTVLLQSAIDAEKNKAVKTELSNELNRLKSSN